MIYPALLQSTNELHTHHSLLFLRLNSRYIPTNNIHTLGMSRLPRNYSWMVWIVVTKNVVLPTLFTHQRRYIFSILWRWLGPFIDGYFFHRSHEWSVESDILMDMVGGPIPTPIQCTVLGKREINQFQLICLSKAKLFSWWIKRFQLRFRSE